MLYDNENDRILSDNEYERKVKEIIGRNSNHPCSFPSCNNKSIYSHSISKSISLTTIAEDGHLITVLSKRKKDEKILSFELKSINDATAFKGFCLHCDSQLFKAIDENEIANSDELILQLYRSVSFEIHKEKIGQLNKDRFEWMKSDEIINRLSETHTLLNDDKGKSFYYCYVPQYSR